MGTITLTGLSKRFGTFDALKDIDLAIEDGELIVFVGPSGCGKSTLLRQIAGLDKPTSGEIRIDGKLVNDVDASDRGLAMVFQSYALYPHMSVRQNMAFGLENAGMAKAEIETRIAEAARMLEIGALLSRRPAQLSGGQRQRVAIGRAIVREPSAFLLDEPLSNLDAELRVSTRAELAALHQRLATTMIYVTHDQVEAMTLADRIVVLRAGRIEQVGRPLDLYNTPANTFVAGFIGTPRMNLLPAEVIAADAGGTRVRIAGGAEFSVPVDGRALPAGGRATLGIRPHALREDPAGPLETTVRLVEALGAETQIHADVAGGGAVIAVLAGQRPHALGEAVRLAADPADLHLFDADGRRVPPAG
jgi:ABC-type sugar transport system ATPase subunit